MRTKNKLNIRTVVLSAIMVIIFFAYTVRVVDLQVTDREKYLKQASGITTKTVTVKAARGEILDTYGRPIAVNRDGYNIVFNRAYIDMESVNETISVLISYLEKEKQAWNDDLPFSKKSVTFKKNSDDDIVRLKNILGLNSYATAQNCYDSMVTRYGLEDFDLTTQRKIMGVRYSMEKADFSVSLPYTFAEDVGNDIMTTVFEVSNELSGVEIDTVPVREYVNGGSVAPHIIGMVGSIPAEDWEEYKEKGYSYDDKVGVSGVEYAYEEYLHGTDGEITYKLDNEGNIVSSEVTKKAVAGNTVILSLDKTLQISAQDALQDLILELQKKNSEVSGGSIVVSNVKTGNIITAANYPSYNMEDYNEKYSELAADTVGMPLLNRAFMGAYPPGSAFKPAVASIGLYLNKITPYDTVYCAHKYTYYKDSQPVCMGYHGSLNVVKALSVSCNVFFYDLGRRIGITDMNKYCLQYGLGVKTGIEVPESAGTLAGSDYSESIGSIWSPGMTLQAAIGQSDNMFTPLQLCMYTSTIANNGTRYKASLLNKIMNYSLTDTVYEYEPKVLNKIKFPKSVFTTVKQGMLSVTTEGTGSTVFDNYSIKVGGKSGTAENPPHGDHSVFIAFAPFDSPEIAVSVIIEHGLKSYVSGSLVKAVFDEYFFKQYGKSDDARENQILK